MRKLAILIAVLALAASMARAEVLETTGSVNVRDMPSLEGNVLGAVPEGTRMDYMGISVVDERDVDWYKVWFEEREGWMSSRYATLVEGEGSDLYRHQIFRNLGILTIFDTIIVRVRASYALRNDARLRISVGTWPSHDGGTDGYSSPWLVGEGVAAEIDADLDGDDEDELLVIYRAQAAEDDKPVWTAIIYERDGDGYVRAAEIPLDILAHGTNSRGVKLIERDGKMSVAVIRLDEWDGGGRAASVTLFDYDGQAVTIPFMAKAQIGAESYAVTGNFPLDWYEGFDGRGTSSRAELEESLEGYGEVYSYSPAESAIVQTPEFVEQARDGEIVGPEEHERTLEIMKQYGIEVFPHVLSEEEEGAGTITFHEEDEGETLLWVQESTPDPDMHSTFIELHTNLDHKVE